MKKQRKFVAAIVAINMLATSIISPLMVKAKSEYNDIQNSVNLAIAEKNFYYYNMAFGKIMELPESYERDVLLAQLSTITNIVWTKDISDIVQSFHIIAKEKSGREYDRLQRVINTSSLKEIDKQYLLNELNTWGRDTVWTADYKKAIDAIIKVWTGKTEAAALEAEKAISELKVELNKEYLTELLDEAKNAVGLGAVLLDGKYFDGLINKIYVGDGKSVNLDLSNDIAPRTVTLRGDIKNLTINAPKATIILENATVANVTIKDIAGSSLHLKGTTKVQSLLVDDRDNASRIVLEGKASVVNAEIKSGTKIEVNVDKDVTLPFGNLLLNTVEKKNVQLLGDFKDTIVKLQSPVQLSIENIVKRVEIGTKAANSIITISKNSKINQVVADAPLTIDGPGVISSVLGAASNQITYKNTSEVPTGGGNTGGGGIYIPPDTTAPVITLAGSATVNVAYGATYTDAGASANEALNGSIQVIFKNAQGTIIPSINTTIPGTYKVVYTATDTSGNTGTKERTVIVAAPIPVLSDLNSGTDLYQNNYAITGADAEGTYGPADETKQTIVNGNLDITDINANVNRSIVLQNMKITGTLVVDYGSGTIRLVNVDANQVIIRNVGRNSLFVSGDSNITTLDVEDSNNDAHIVVEENGTIANANIQSGAQIETNANATNTNPIGNLNLAPGSPQPISLSGSFQTVNVTESADITLGQGTEVTDKINLVAPSMLTVPEGASVGTVEIGSSPEPQARSFAKAAVSYEEDAGSYILNGNIGSVRLNGRVRVSVEAGSVGFTGDSNGDSSIFVSENGRVSVPEGTFDSSAIQGDGSVEVRTPSSEANLVEVKLNGSSYNKATDTILNISTITTVGDLIRGVVASDFAKVEVLNGETTITDLSAKISGYVNQRNEVTAKLRITSEDGQQSHSFSLKLTPLPTMAETYPKSTAGDLSSKTINSQVLANQNGTVYVVAVAKNSTRPTAEQIKAGKDAAGNLAVKAKASVAAGVVTEIKTMVPQDNTEYDLYFVLEDNQGNLQNNPYKTTVASPEALDTANDIVSYSIKDRKYSFAVNKEQKYIEFHVVEGTDLTQLIPVITVSSKAQVINAVEGAKVDFTNPATYIVKAQSGDEATWTVKCVVDQKVVTSASIKTLPTKRIYRTGESLDLTGLTLEVKYNDGSTASKTVTNAEVQGFDSRTEAENQVLSINVEGKIVTYTIQVVQKPAAPALDRNDDNNTIIGTMTTDMEYKLDTAAYVTYKQNIFDAINLRGDHTLRVRIAAKGIKPASDPKTLNFTASQIELDLMEAKEAAQLNQSDFTPESWMALDIALAMPEVSNAEIVDKTQAINGAISNLVTIASEVEKSLQAAKAAANLTEAEYTPTSWTLLATATAMPETNPQEMISKTQAINFALKGLVKVADQNLQNAKTAASVLMKNKADYSAASWAVLTNALLMTEKTDADKLTKAAAINAAIGRLVPLVEANLQTAKDNAAALNAADYTPNSWKVLTDALAMPQGSNTEKSAMTRAINSAIAALVTKAAAASAQLALDLQDAKARAAVLIPSNYTAESWRKITDALALSEGTDFEKSNKIQKINEGISALVTAEAQKIEDNLQAAIASADALVPSQADYTTDSWNVLATAKSSPVSTTNEKLAKTNSINNAIKALVFKADLSLQAARNKAAGKVQADYTAVTWKVLSDALAMPEATAAQKAAKATAISSAVDNLKKVVDANLEAAEASALAVQRGKYTPASLDALDKARALSVENDGLKLVKIAAINNAIARLITNVDADLITAKEAAALKLKDNYTVISWDRLVTALGMSTSTDDEKIAKTAAINAALLALIEVDREKPVITLVGGSSVTVDVKAAYTELGATVTDNRDNLQVVITGTVDTTKVGVYEVKYNATDLSGNKALEVTRKVYVVDSSKPVITLNGNTVETVEVGTVYTDAGATVSDNYYQNLSAVVTGLPDITRVGTYIVKYNVTDASGNKAIEVTRTVRVVDTKAPVITLNGAENIILTAGDAYTEQGASVTDNYDKNLQVAITGTVDNTKPGTYVIKYNATDLSGNKAAEVTRTVIVKAKDATAPAITSISVTRKDNNEVINLVPKQPRIIDLTPLVTTDGIIKIQYADITLDTSIEGQNNDDLDNVVRAALDFATSDLSSEGQAKLIEALTELGVPTSGTVQEIEGTIEKVVLGASLLTNDQLMRISGTSLTLTDAKGNSATYRIITNQALIQANAAVLRAEGSNLQADVDAARQAVSALTGNFKASLVARLDAVQAAIGYQQQLSTATEAVKAAEASNKQEDVDHARVLVEALQEADRTSLGRRLDAVQKIIDDQIAYEKQLAEATTAVAAAEASTEQKDVDSARLLVDALHEADRISLGKKLDDVQKIINARLAYEQQLAQATSAVVKAEGSKLQSDLNTASTLVNALPDNSAKTELLNRIKNVQDAIDYLAKVNAATAAVVKAEGSKVQADVDSAKLLVEALPAGKDKTDLLARINAVQATIDNYKAQLSAAETAVANAQATKSQADLDSARQLVDALNAADKTRLGAVLDTLQALVTSRTELQSAIREAAKLLDSKVVGNEPGNIPQQDRDAFKDAINAAVEVRDNLASTKGQIDAQIQALADATTKFNNAVIKDASQEFDSFVDKVMTVIGLYGETSGLYTVEGQAPNWTVNITNTNLTSMPVNELYTKVVEKIASGAVSFTTVEKLMNYLNTATINGGDAKAYVISKLQGKPHTVAAIEFLKTPTVEGYTNLINALANNDTYAEIVGVLKETSLFEGNKQMPRLAFKGMSLEEVYIEKASENRAGKLIVGQYYSVSDIKAMFGIDETTAEGTLTYGDLVGHSIGFKLKGTAGERTYWFNKSVSTADSAVLKAEGSKLQADVDSARLLADKVTIETDRLNLHRRLDAVQVAINSQLEYKDQVAAASAAVRKAEDTAAQINVNTARALVNTLRNDMHKNDLLSAINNITIGAPKTRTQALNLANITIESYIDELALVVSGLPAGAKLRAYDVDGKLVSLSTKPANSSEDGIIGVPQYAYEPGRVYVTMQLSGQYESEKLEVTFNVIEERLKELNTLINEADNHLKYASVGSAPYQCTQEGKDALVNAIPLARATAAKTNPTLEEINAAVEDILAAIDQYQKSINTVLSIFETKTVTESDTFERTIKVSIEGLGRFADQITTQDIALEGDFYGLNVKVSRGVDANEASITLAGDLNKVTGRGTIVIKPSGWEGPSATRELRASITVKAIGEPADKDDLLNTINMVKETLLYAIPATGTKPEPGQCTPEAKAALEAELTSAEAVEKDPTSSQEAVDQARRDLEDVWQAYYASIYTALSVYTPNSVTENTSLNANIKVYINGNGGFDGYISPANILLGEDFSKLTVANVIIDTFHPDQAEIILTGNLQRIKGFGTITVNEAGWHRTGPSTPLTVQITVKSINDPADKTILSNSIMYAQDILEDAVVGDKPGQCSAEAKAALAAALAAAKAVSVDDKATQEQVDAARIAIDNARDAYERAVIAGIVAEVPAPLTPGSNIRATVKLRFIGPGNFSYNYNGVTLSKNDISLGGDLAGLSVEDVVLSAPNYGEAFITLAGNLAYTTGTGTITVNAAGWHGPSEPKPLTASATVLDPSVLNVISPISSNFVYWGQGIDIGFDSEIIVPTDWSGIKLVNSSNKEIEIEQVFSPVSNMLAIRSDEVISGSYNLFIPAGTVANKNSGKVNKDINISYNVRLAPVEKIQLNATIARIQTSIVTEPIGDLPGQIPQSALEALNRELAAAKALIESENPSPADMEAAYYYKLPKAETNFWRARKVGLMYMPGTAGTPIFENGDFDQTIQVIISHADGKFVDNIGVSDIIPGGDFAGFEIRSVEVVKDATPVSGKVAKIRLAGSLQAIKGYGTITVSSGSWQGPSGSYDITATININKEITFPDKNLEAAIRARINKPTGAIYKSDVEGITELAFGGKAVTSLSGIENLVNLQRLTLEGHQISDISMLRNLTNLRELNMANNQIADISVLGNLVNLERIILENNGISDISALQGLTKLMSLTIGKNSISDISVLENLTRLENLYLDGNQISDISVLQNLSALRILDLSYNQISNIDVLKTLVTLNNLNLDYNQISKEAISSLRQALPASCIISAQTAMMTGNVLNPDGTVALKGTIFAFSPQTGTSNTSRVIDGRFKIGVPSDGEYLITASPYWDSPYIESEAKKVTVVNGVVTPEADAKFDLQLRKPLITGTVIDSNGEPRFGGSAEIWTQAGTYKGSVNNYQGRFLIANLEDGVYNIVVYKNATGDFMSLIAKTIEVKDKKLTRESDANLVFDFSNLPQATVSSDKVYLGESVTVSSNRSGFIYFVKDFATTIPVVTISALEAAVAKGDGIRYTVTADSGIQIDTSSLSQGLYYVYGVDGANNISTARGVSVRATTLSANPSSVTENNSFDQTIQLYIDGTWEFTDNLDKSSISLGGDFSNLTVQSLTLGEAADPSKNTVANVRVAGSLKRTAGIGSITVKAEAFAESATKKDLIASVNVDFGAIVSDNYEPDNYRTSAILIPTNGTHQTHTIYPSGDVDWVKFEAIEGATYSIRTSNIENGNTDTKIYLYNSNGNYITENDDAYFGTLASQIDFTAPSAGTYYVKIQGLNMYLTGQYDISVTQAADLIPPVLTVSRTSAIAGELISVTSSEKGIVYLVQADLVNSTGVTLDNILSIMASGMGSKITLADTYTRDIATYGLRPGNYIVYAVDKANNISEGCAVNLQPTSLRAEASYAAANPNFDRTIRIAINGFGTLRDGISASDITLGGDLSTLNVVSVAKVAGEAAKADIRLAGTLNYGTGEGTITVKASAWSGLDQAHEIQAVLEIREAEEAVSFPDLNLEKAIREELGKLTGDIYKSEIEGLTELDADNAGIRNLSGIEKLTSLQHLSLFGNRIKDVNPLKSLRSLVSLELGGNMISSADITALQNALPGCTVYAFNQMFPTVNVTVTNPDGTYADSAYIQLLDRYGNLISTKVAPYASYNPGNMANGVYQIVAIPGSETGYCESETVTFTVTDGDISPESVAYLTLSFRNPVIHGTVKEPDGDLLNYGRIEIRDSSDVYVTSEYINGGQYKIPALPDGVYKVVAVPDVITYFKNSDTKTITVVDGKVTPQEDANLNFVVTAPMLYGNIRRQGQVFDVSGTVRVASQSGAVVSSNMIDKGVFSIEDLPDGIYEVYVYASGSGSGTHTAHTTITVAGGKVPAIGSTLVLDVELDTTAPIVTLNTQGPVVIGQSISAEVNESCGLFLVSAASVVPSQVTYAALEKAVNDGNGTRMYIEVKSTQQIYTGGLQEGDYYIYAIDDANLISAPISIKLQAYATADKTAINNEIKAALLDLQNSRSGEKPGECSNSANIDWLSQMLTAAQVKAQDPTATQSQVDNAFGDLRRAREIYTRSIVIGITVDGTVTFTEANNVNQIIKINLVGPGSFASTLNSGNITLSEVFTGMTVSKVEIDKVNNTVAYITLTGALAYNASLGRIDINEDGWNGNSLLGEAYSHYSINGRINVSVLPPTAPVSPEKVTIVNNKDKEDVITVASLFGGTTVRVYDKDRNFLGESTKPENEGGYEVVRIAQLGANAGSVYISLQRIGESESEMVEVAYAAEATAASSKIQDPILEAFIRESYGVTTDEIPTETLNGITELLAFGRHIVSLGGIENLPNLTELVLYDNEITDVAPLARLTKLNTLELTDNPVSNVLPLQAINSLNTLYLSNTQVRDLSQFAGFTNLNTLGLGINNLGSITGLQVPKSLRQLTLYDNSLSDLTPLQSLVDLTFLNLSNNHISDLTPLSNLKNLTELHLVNNQISDITALKSLTKLNRLEISNNSISAADLQSLREALPNCYIYAYDQTTVNTETVSPVQQQPVTEAATPAASTSVNTTTIQTDNTAGSGTAAQTDSTTASGTASQTDNTTVTESATQPQQPTASDAPPAQPAVSEEPKVEAQTPVTDSTASTDLTSGNATTTQTGSTSSTEGTTPTQQAPAAETSSTEPTANTVETVKSEQPVVTDQPAVTEQTAPAPVLQTTETPSTTTGSAITVDQSKTN